MLGRFYAICNCCSCCCGAMQAQRNNVPMLASSGYICQVEAEMCEACGTCVEYCQFDALSVDNGHATVDVEACMGCGVCVSKCRQEAISLILDAGKGEPLEIQMLMAQAAPENYSYAH
jgi:heterodisulfide reductase subunit A-like polyferredoxin